MPALKNPKWERFAQALADGRTADQVYQEAGIEPRLCGRRLSAYYVYALADPFTGFVFYIGKGKRARYVQHWLQWKRRDIVNVAKHERISQIAARGGEPAAYLVEDGLSEPDAFKLEAYLIRSIGRDVLTNYGAGRSSTYDKALAAANMLLGRVMKFEDWLKNRARTQTDIELYWYVRLRLIRNRDNLDQLVHG